MDELTNQYQRSPKIHEIAEYLEISEEDVLEAMEMGKSYQTASVDMPIETGSEGNAVTALDIIGSPDEGFEKVDQNCCLRAPSMYYQNEKKRLSNARLSRIRVKRNR